MLAFSMLHLSGIGTSYPRNLRSTVFCVLSQVGYIIPWARSASGWVCLPVTIYRLVTLQILLRSDRQERCACIADFGFVHEIHF